MSRTRWHSLSVALWWWTPLTCALAVVGLLVLDAVGVIHAAR